MKPRSLILSLLLFLPLLSQATTVYYMVGNEPVIVEKNTQTVYANKTIPDEWKTIVEDGITYEFICWSETLNTGTAPSSGTYTFNDNSTFRSNRISSTITLPSSTTEYTVYAVYRQKDYYPYFDKTTSASDLTYANLEKDVPYIIMGGSDGAIYKNQYSQLVCNIKNNKYEATRSIYSADNVDYSTISSIAAPNNNNILWYLIPNYTNTQYAFYNKANNKYIYKSYSNNKITNTLSSSAQYCTITWKYFKSSYNVFISNSNSHYLVCGWGTNTKDPDYEWIEKSSNKEAGEYTTGKAWLFLYKGRQYFRQWFKTTRSIDPVEYIDATHLKVESYVLSKTTKPWTTSYSATYTTNNNDGTFTVQFSQGASSITVRWYDSSNNSYYVKSQTFQVPHLYSGTSGWGTPYNSTSWPANNADVVLLRNATVNAQSSTFTLRKLTLYPGSTLNLNGATITTDTLILRFDGDEFSASENNAPQIVFNSGTLNVKSKLFIERRLDENRYYWLSMPYALRTFDYENYSGSYITYANFYANGAVYPTKNSDYFLFIYDGITRNSENKTAAEATYWTDPKLKATYSSYDIPAGNAFLFGINDQQTATSHTYRTYRFSFRDFPTYASQSLSSQETALKTNTAVILSAYDRSTSLPLASAENAAADTHDHNKGWNLLANPYLHTLNINASSNILTGQWDSIRDPYGNWTGEFELRSGTESIPYISRYQPATDSYEQLRINTDKGIDIQPLSTFFVQINSGSQVQFSSTLNAKKIPAYQRRTAVPSVPVYADLSISSSDADTARCGIVIHDSFSADYEIGADLHHLNTNTSILDIYSSSLSLPLAFNALPEDLATDIPISINTPTIDSYTISLDSTSTLPYLSSVLLTDHTLNTTTDLLNTPYTFTPLYTSTDHNRFSLSISIYDTPENTNPTDPTDPTDTTTSLNDPIATSAQVIGSNIFISNIPTPALITVFDSAGKTIATLNTTQPQVHIPISISGLFIIHITTPTQSFNLRTIRP